LNLLLAAVALRSWWRESLESKPQANADEFPDSLCPPSGLGIPTAHEGSIAFRPDSVRHFQLEPFLATLRAIAPWLLLALIFYIPGVYLEWPSDPWEHLRRIYEWRSHSQIADFTAGYKALYFLPYSLVAGVSSAQGLQWLGLYYSAMCLLVCWQYYRLARAVDLASEWATLFVIINVLTFGNVSFSFFRYYGLGTTVFSQIGALALIRATLVLAKNLSCTGPPWRPALHAAAPDNRSILHSVWSRLGLWLGGVFLLGLLTARSHVQGLGIAALGMAGVLIWRMVSWKSYSLLALISFLVVASLAVVNWWPRPPFIDSVYRAQGWLNSYYGFGIVEWPSPSCDRVLQILGAFGLINTVAGIILVFRNHPVGWLTLAPLIALAVPAFALPFATVLGNSSIGNIAMFHRMLFAVPSGLAVVVFGREILVPRLRLAVSRRPWTGAMFVFLGLAVALVVPGNRLAFNRTWQLLARVPDDLELRNVSTASDFAASQVKGAARCRFVTLRTVNVALNAFSPELFPEIQREIARPAAFDLEDPTALPLWNQPTVDCVARALNRNPAADDPNAWLTIDGVSQQHASRIQDFGPYSTGIQNPPGHLSAFLCSEFVPISPTLDYCIEMSAIQRTGDSGTAYLIIMWYDAKQRLLPADVALPDGAGDPRGWANGTSSCFGILGTIVPRTWTTYRQTFGRHSGAAIPAAARFVRIGARLNSNEAPRSTIQLTDVRIWHRFIQTPVASGVFPSDERLYVIVPERDNLYSFSSLSGVLSTHWIAQELASDLAGADDLVRAARVRGTLAEGSDGIVFVVPSWGERLRTSR
jgi:hypothetical protein